jgi:hypothetical protein
MSFVREKVIKGVVRHYLVQNTRVKDRKTGRSKVKQDVIAYLGVHETVEDAYHNATSKRRRKLEKYRKPEYRVNDAAMETIAREYQRKMREASKKEIESVLPHLHHPKKDRVQWTPWPPDDPLPF